LRLIGIYIHTYTHTRIYIYIYIYIYIFIYMCAYINNKRLLVIRYVMSSPPFHETTRSHVLIHVAALC